MRILHAIYDDIENPWVGGGGATRTLEIYRRAVRSGHRVVVLCGRYPGAPVRRVRDGVRYRYVGGGRSHVWSRLTYMIGAARLIRRGGYDIVIEDVSPYSPIFSPMWSSRAPAVASVQNLAGAHAPMKYGLLGYGPNLVERPLLRTFRHFVAVSPGITAELRRIRPGATVQVVPNSADPIFFTGAGVAGETQVEQPYILSLGRIDVYQKGLDRLIEAFELVRQSNTELKLAIAGGGTPQQERDLLARVEASPQRGTIKLPGQVPPGEAAALMRGALLVVMPSRYEAWPLAAIEAGAAGVPVVGSNIVGVRDAAPQFPAGHGELLPDGDVEALAQAILRIAGDEVLRRQMGERGRNWAAQFTWDALAKRQLEFYKETVNNNEF
jgi:glycosyltransferase involved in cell wall biosynthesis